MIDESILLRQNLQIFLYPFAPQSRDWFVIELLLLLGPLSHFEKSYGTIHTMFFMVLTAFMIGASYSVVGLFFPTSTTLSGPYYWVYFLLGYYTSATEQKIPFFKTRIKFNVTFLEVVGFILCKIYIMHDMSLSTILLHLCAGFVVANYKDILDYFVLYPDTINRIEDKLLPERPDFLPYGIVYTREREIDRMVNPHRPGSGSPSPLPRFVNEKIQTKK
ncbi:hypothetical protein KAFR_0F01070 [Kazachstania africana CBS 2517]|uniref:Derlin n=1 Tax=Kazachstania africana (strain ATCC 22294 / BCRC 22015 / CBS 2517 / CECT 1963 / NBRC 1671 / NRRL Y-8276) TaxID=1071382 RepID=H2AWF3_KAZAF|nr:hypothetical protein KAFR_0F01070 [Kazachstania africana CBS 2517]CCF58703.1 hypothetical protein KAFR_0F01070 [Kazachstania africana CBS 2517]